MSSNDSARKFAPATGISWTDNGGPLVLFNAGSGTYHSLNDVAAANWRLLVEGQSEREIVAILAARYCGDPAVIAADVREFIDTAQSGGLLVKR